MCTIIYTIIKSFFSHCLSKIEKYNKDCEEKELREKLINENPYYILD
jgi:hypothetical protein